jgi:hypothetical protein
MKIRIIVFTILAPAMLLFTSLAHAGFWNAIPRWITLYPFSSSMGSSGYIRLTLAPSGGDTFYYFYSVGATDTTNCDMNYLYTSDQLLALYQNLQRAHASGQKIAWSSNTPPKTHEVMFGYP